MRSRRQAGFSVLELLVISGIIGILAAIAIMSYRGSLDRAKQKRTMSDIRTIAEAWEARAAETHSYQVAGFTFPTVAVSYAELDAALRPNFARDLPERDAWMRPLEFALAEGANGTTIYAIRSAGRDGVFEGSYTVGATTDPDCDIVYSNGAFIAWPEVAQTH